MTRWCVCVCVAALAVSVAAFGREDGDAHIAPRLVPSQPITSPPQLVEVTPVPPPHPASERSSTKYSPETTAMLLNYCRESLYKIVEYNDRAVLDEEYGKLVNNIDITRIQDDEAAQLIESLLIELNALKLTETEKQYLMDAYNKRIQNGVLDVFKGGKNAPSVSSTEPATLACQAILFMASGIASFRSEKNRLKQDVAERALQLQAEDLKRLTVLRTQFFDTEYKLYKRYDLPDRLNLKEVQLAQYIKVLADEDSQRRLERLERLKDDFDAFPPFWYTLGKAAQDTNGIDLAKSYYSHFEHIQPHVFREDQEYVQLCMHRILLFDPESEVESIRQDLRTIESNTKYYYKWENVLFAALMYYRLDDLENARRLIRQSINEGYCVPLHESVLVEMESLAARANLQGMADGLVEKADLQALDAIEKIGPEKQLDALRALGKQITDIAVTMAPRSHAAQGMSYFVPVYNLYAIGRQIGKQDGYNDDCIAHLPIAWFDKGRPKLRLEFKGRSFKPAGVSVDKESGQGHVTFARIFKEKDIVEKQQEWPVVLRIEGKNTALELEFQVQPVTDRLRKLRPELPPDEPYFELRTIKYQKREYKVRDGLIIYEP
ncbi:MAG: hypothetical protein NTU83_01820 [Candidatus Hydrogenedentes bacterium]|nr:hypothetical protein [Candidatus Hydrogenedentota bacterium]